jgi:opacity protein-like surface antigen
MENKMSFQLKQTIGLAIVAAFISSSATAQVVDPQTPVPQPSVQPAVVNTAPPVTFGIKGGLNYSDLDLVDDTLPVKPVLGGIGGIFFGGNITSAIGMQIEALYSQRGAQDDLEEADAKVRLTYIDVPVTFHVGTSAANGARVHLFTGPQIAYKLDSEIINDLDGTTTDTSENIKDWDFGWTIGAGVSMQRVSLDARYTHGFTNINNTSGPEVKNRAVTVMVGIRLR